MRASEVRRLKEIEAKHPKLKRIYAHLAMENEALKERINRCYRREVFDAYFFGSLEEVREITHHWTTSYNEERPHQSLGNLPSAFFRQQQAQTKNQRLSAKNSFFQISLWRGSMQEGQYRMWELA